MPVMVTILKKDGELMLTQREELSSNVNVLPYWNLI